MQFPSIPVFIDCIPVFRNRAEYAFRMLGLIAGFTPEFVTEAAADGLCYAYDDPGSSSVWLPASRRAHDFLQQKNIYDPASSTEVEIDGAGALCVFPVDGALAGDIIAATFFFLSLHEEWSSEVRDEFGRFTAEASLLGKLGLLDRPVVAEYAAIIKSAAERAGCKVFDGNRYRSKAFAIAVTHDIDYITKATPGLMYREGVKYFLLNQLHQPFGARAKRLREYLGYCMSQASDPYRQSLKRMKEEEQRRDIRGTWFFKAGGKDKRDTGYLPSHSFVSGVLTELRNDGHEIGIHPSFLAHTDEAMFAAEKEALAQYAGPVASCRQHYLRFVYPDTWRIQVGQGIRVDSTMGFAAQEGFRNGTCHPFQPYDLERDESMPLWEVPLVMMDGSLNFYRGMSPEESLQRIGAMLSIVEKYRGAVSILFHNVVYDTHDFPGWGRVFEATLDTIQRTGALSVGIQDIIEGFLEGFTDRE